MKVLGIALFVVLSASAAAQNYPVKPLTLVIPFAAGGGIDASARIQAQHMSSVLGQTIVAENIGAAGGMVGSLRVSNATPDGYTFLIGNTGTHAYNQSLYRKPLYNPAADFTHIGLVSESARILVVRKDMPVKNLQEFVGYVKANQAKMQFASAGVGSGTHLPCVLLNLAMGADVTHIPFKGAGPAMQAVIGGHVDYMCDTIQTGAIQVKNQTVKGLAVMSSRRVPIIDLATTGEQGLPRTDATVWNAFFFPRNTPDALVRRMNRVLSDTVDNPGVRKRLEDVGLEIVPTERRSPEYLAKFVPEEIERWARVVKAAGITPE